MTNERADEIESAEFDAVVAARVVTPGQVKPNAFDEILRWIKPGESMVVPLEYEKSNFYV